MPDSLDFAIAENEAAALARKLDTPTRGWEGLLAVAQSVMARFQDLPGSSTLENVLLDYRSVAPLVAAARIFDAMAIANPTSDLQDMRDLSLQAMTCYAMYGNFPTATAVAKRAGLVDGASASALAIVGVCCPSLIEVCLAQATDLREATGLFDQLNALIVAGQGRVEALEEALAACYPQCDPFERALLLSSRLAMHQTIRLAAHPALTKAGLSHAAVQGIVDSGVVTLLPPQIRAIEAALIASSDNAFVSLPTSAGKTLLGELCMLRSLQDGPGVAVFIAPYIAIGRQVGEALLRHVPADVEVLQSFGAFGTSEGLPTFGSIKAAVVATPERFDGLLRQGDLAANLRCVVIDEAHLIDNDARGLRLEGIIARLRLLQAQGHRFRIVALSAVIARPAAFCEWLGVPEDSRHIDAWRPTARRLGMWSHEGTLLWYRSDDIIRPENTRRTSPLGSKRLPWPHRAPPPTSFHGVVKKQRPQLYQNVAYLCEYLNDESSPPTLCICATRAATRVLATAVASRRLDATSFRSKQAALVKLLEGQHTHLRPLADMVRKGVAYHNSSLPQVVRFLIEDCVREGSLAAVCATTTLAEGVDLPFRNTIIADWLLYRGDGEQPMAPLLFRNIAGRCGRAGTFTEGDTIIFDNMLGNEAFTAPHLRNASRDSLLDEPAPLSSFLARSLGQHAEAAEAEIASQFMAAISENPRADDLASDFSQALFGSRTADADAIATRVVAIRASLLGEQGGPAFARAASPLNLTDLGVAANAGGFSPSSVMMILKAIPDIGIDLAPVDALTRLIATLSHLPEQRDFRWKRKLLKPATRLMVRRDDLGAVLTAWLAGEGPIDIFASLPAVQRSSRRPPVRMWIDGDASNDDWTAEFDKFLDFMNAVVEQYLPWLIYACGLLCPLLPDPGVRTMQFETLRSVVRGRSTKSDPIEKHGPVGTFEIEEP